MKKILFALIVSLLSACGGKPVDKKGLDLVTYMVFDDVDIALDGGDSLVSKSDYLSIFKINQEISAKKYEASFEINEVTANLQFKGKRLLINGQIQSIETGLTGGPILVLLGSSQFLGIRAEMEKSELERVSRERKGDFVSLICKGAGKSMMASLDDCVYRSSYLFPAIRDYAREAIRGKVNPPSKLAQSIALFYVIAPKFDDGSACLSSTRSSKIAKKCEKEFEAMVKEDPMTKEEKDRLNVKYQSLVDAMDSAKK